VCDWLKLRALTVEKFRARVEERTQKRQKQQAAKHSLAAVCPLASEMPDSAVIWLALDAQKMLHNLG
jgi:hypothetical protein